MNGSCKSEMHLMLGERQMDRTDSSIRKESLLLVFTLAFTGFPYTYKKLGDLFGRYFAFSIVGMFFYWGFKIMVAMIAGWVVYPIVLVYTVIQYLRMRNAERQYFNEI